MPINRRDALLLPLLGLCGCASTLRNSPYWSTIRTGIIGTPKNPAISRKSSDGLPYANIAAWFDGAPPAILVLGTINTENVLDWYGQGGKLVSTKGPFVVRAIGFGVDLRGVRFGAGWSEDISSMIGDRRSRTAIYQSDSRTEIEFKSSFHAENVEKKNIFERYYTLKKFEERVSAGGRHRFSNQYWVDPNGGFCWKSRQKIIPTEPALNIEILKAAKLG